MHLSNGVSITLAFTLFASLVVSKPAFPQITPSPAAPPPQIAAPPSLVRAVQHAAQIDAKRRLEVRQTDETAGLDMCYSTDSICELWSPLDDACSRISSTLNGGLDWYKCLCQSGWLAVNLACENCINDYGMEDFVDGAHWVSRCSEKGLSIAPIPSSVMSSWSEFNATHTTFNADATGLASFSDPFSSELSSISDLEPSDSPGGFASASGALESFTFTRTNPAPTFPTGPMSGDGGTGSGSNGGGGGGGLVNPLGPRPGAAAQDFSASAAVFFSFLTVGLCLVVFGL